MTKLVVEALTKKAFKENRDLFHLMYSTNSFTKVQIDLAKQLYDVPEMRTFKAVSWSIPLDKIYQWTQEIFKNYKLEDADNIHTGHSAQKVNETRLSAVRKQRPVSAVRRTPKMLKEEEQKSSCSIHVHEFSDLTLEQIKTYISTLMKDEGAEIEASKVSHHKFATVLLACTILTTEITQTMKESVLKGAREQLACVPPLSQIVEKLL